MGYFPDIQNNRLLEHWLDVWFIGCSVIWITVRVAGLKDSHMDGWVYGFPFIC
jgi:hypothetical protein